DGDDEALPVFGTIASQWGDTGVDGAYRFLLQKLEAETGRPYPSNVAVPPTRATPPRRRIVPPERTRYLREIADGARQSHAWAHAQADLAHKAQVLREAGQLVKDPALAARAPSGLTPENAAIL